MTYLYTVTTSEECIPTNILTTTTPVPTTTTTSTNQGSICIL